MESPKGTKVSENYHSHQPAKDREGRQFASLNAAHNEAVDFSAQGVSRCFHRFLLPHNPEPVVPFSQTVFCQFSRRLATLT